MVVGLGRIIVGLVAGDWGMNLCAVGTAVCFGWPWVYRRSEPERNEPLAHNIQERTEMKKSTIAMLCAATFATAAQADIYQWDWSADVDGTAGLNMNGGEFQSIHAQFDSVTDRFLWQVTFADQITDGYTLAVNNGPNPKGHAGELALIYFDASNPNVRVTGYAYNGVNLFNSYQDGSPDEGIQAPDMLFGSDLLGNNDSIIMQASVEDIGTTRVMTLEIDAAGINVHTPANPGPEGPGGWSGIAFDELVGLWMHPMTGVDTAYDQSGALTGLSYSTQGWFDGNNFGTSTDPAPGAMALFGRGGMLAGRRRRN
jgi:hypothetical protein